MNVRPNKKAANIFNAYNIGWLLANDRLLVALFGSVLHKYTLRYAYILTWLLYLLYYISREKCSFTPPRSRYIVYCPWGMFVSTAASVCCVCVCVLMWHFGHRLTLITNGSGWMPARLNNIRIIKINAIIVDGRHLGMGMTNNNKRIAGPNTVLCMCDHVSCGSGMWWPRPKDESSRPKICIVLNIFIRLRAFCPRAGLIIKPVWARNECHTIYPHFAYIGIDTHAHLRIWILYLCSSIVFCSFCRPQP